MDASFGHYRKVLPIRDEFLNVEVFTLSPNAQLFADRWRWKCNALDLRTSTFPVLVLYFNVFASRFS